MTYFVLFMFFKYDFTLDESTLAKVTTFALKMWIFNNRMKNCT